eukprot:365301-Chlamydomonas_euryale.AAC.2
MAALRAELYRAAQLRRTQETVYALTTTMSSSPNPLPLSPRLNARGIMLSSSDSSPPAAPRPLPAPSSPPRCSGIAIDIGAGASVAPPDGLSSTGLIAMAGSVPADKSGCSAVGRPASPAMCASASHPPSGDITMACAPGEPSHGINEPGPHGPLPLPLPLPEPSSSPPSASLAVARSAGRPAAPLCSGAPPECCPASIVSMLVPRRPGLSPPRRPAAPGTGVGCDAYAAAMRPSTDANRSLPPSWKMLEGDTGSGWLSNDVRPGLAAAVDAAAARDCAPVGIDRNGGSDGSAAHAAPPTPLPALPRASASAPNACAPPPAPPPVALPVAPGDVADATRSRLEASSPPAHPRAATTSEASVRSMRAGVGAAPAPAPAPRCGAWTALVKRPAADNEPLPISGRPTAGVPPPAASLPGTEPMEQMPAVRNGVACGGDGCAHAGRLGVDPNTRPASVACASPPCALPPNPTETPPTPGCPPPLCACCCSAAGGCGSATSGYAGGVQAACSEEAGPLWFGAAGGRTAAAPQPPPPATAPAMLG